MQLGKQGEDAGVREDRTLFIRLAQDGGDGLRRGRHIVCELDERNQIQGLASLRGSGAAEGLDGPGADVARTRKVAVAEERVGEPGLHAWGAAAGAEGTGEEGDGVRAEGVRDTSSGSLGVGGARAVEVEGGEHDEAEDDMLAAGVIEPVLGGGLLPGEKVGPAAGDLDGGGVEVDLAGEGEGRVGVEQNLLALGGVGGLGVGEHDVGVAECGQQLEA